MNKIKSFEELKDIRMQAQNRTRLRETGERTDKTVLAVGMATCGIAAGARETLLALSRALEDQQIENTVLIQTGCLGYCYTEPVVEVRIPGQAPILYGDVDAVRAQEIVRLHLKEGRLLDHAIIGKGFERP